MDKSWTGYWLVLSAHGREPDYLAGRFSELEDASDLANALVDDGEDARVVKELYDERNFSSEGDEQ